MLKSVALVLVAAWIRSLDEFIGEEAFFVEWRMETDGDRSELPWGGPSNFALGGFGGVNYGFSIASDQMDLNRDNDLPIIVVNFTAGIPHTHRLELFGADLYVWYLDGEIIDQGEPEGAFPCCQPGIVWRAKSAFLAHTTRWQYIRYGRIAQDASGDFDSSGDVYHWVGYPNAARELEILRRRAPEADLRLSRQIVGFVQELRNMDLFKLPGVAETIDWTKALTQLDTIALDPETINNTLGVLLKYQDDIAQVQGSEAARVLNQVKAELAAAG